MLFFVAAVLIFGMPVMGQRTLRVATWNIENAYDTVRNEDKEDMEYLPVAARKWNSIRYWSKLRGIAKTLAAMELPFLVGIQEVENDTVLRDLTRRTVLWPARYRYLVTDSPDRRGMNVALLYDEKCFSLLSWRTVSIPSFRYGLRPTRDILVAEGLTGVDTLYVCVVHFPSRRGNNRMSQQHRTLAVETLCGVLDSLEGRKVLVMGDFNAEPDDRLFSAVSSRVCTLVPTDRKVLNGARGTYYFRGVWGFLDHILVSPRLLPYACGEAKECRFPWLLRTDKRIPRRTYGGTAYLGGLSDHLPLVADIKIVERTQ